MGTKWLSVRRLRTLLARRIVADRKAALLNEKSTIEKSIRRLDDRIAKLKGESPVVAHKRVYHISKAGMANIIEGQRRRWAAYHKRIGNGGGS